MKETRKIIPFLAAACTVFALFYFNPPQETHVDRIKAEYIEHNPKTWPVTWWNYERSLDYRNYLFFSVIERKGRLKSIGVSGGVVLTDEL